MDYAHISDVKAGDVLVTDGGFTCLPGEVKRRVYTDASGELFIKCRDGKHYLDGQCFHDDGRLVGLRKVSELAIPLPSEE